MWVKTSTIFFILIVIITSVCAFPVMKNEEAVRPKLKQFIIGACRSGYIRVHGKCVPKLNEVGSKHNNNMVLIHIKFILFFTVTMNAFLKTVECECCK